MAFLFFIVTVVSILLIGDILNQLNIWSPERKTSIKRPNVDSENNSYINENILEGHAPTGGDKHSQGIASTEDGAFESNRKTSSLSESTFQPPTTTSNLPKYNLHHATQPSEAAFSPYTPIIIYGNYPADNITLKARVFSSSETCQFSQECKFVHISDMLIVLVPTGNPLGHHVNLELFVEMKKWHEINIPVHFSIDLNIDHIRNMVFNFLHFSRGEPVSTLLLTMPKQNSLKKDWAITSKNKIKKLAELIYDFIFNMVELNKREKAGLLAYVEELKLKAIDRIEEKSD